MFNQTKLVYATMALTVSSVCFASSPLKLSSDIYLECTTIDDLGQKEVTLEEPKMVLPGDNLVFVVKYQNVGR